MRIADKLIITVTQLGVRQIKREVYLMKKRTLSLILATAMVAGSIVGCGGGSSSSAPAEEPAAEAEAPAEEAAEAPAEEAAEAPAEEAAEAPAADVDALDLLADAMAELEGEEELLGTSEEGEE